MDDFLASISADGLEPFEVLDEEDLSELIETGHVSVIVHGKLYQLHLTATYDNKY